MSEFTKNLENSREKIEGASCLHQYIKTSYTKTETHDEMIKLAEKLGNNVLLNRIKDDSDKSEINCTSPNSSSTPYKSSSASSSCICNWNERHGDGTLSSCNKKGQSELFAEEDEEEHSKLADSGLGGCERCEGNEKLVRVCSCQSFEEVSNMYDKR